jgi:YHS domain-containing protein
VLWILLGWRFTLAEFVGGAVLILLMTLLLRLFVSRKLEAEAREHARSAETGHIHGSAESTLPLRRRLRSAEAWSDVAHNFRGDWQMLWKEVGIGFLLAGFAGLIPNRTFEAVFLHDAPAPVRLLENVVVGPLIAVVSFVCSVGNIPLAAVLWSGGISFAGVLAFIFADLIVLPILAIYRKYYGSRFALRITALMFVTMALAALVIDGIFGAAHLIPHTRPERRAVFMPIGVDYKLVLNVLALAAFAALVTLTLRRGAKDPMCGMTVDRAKALRLEVDGRTYYFCGAGCRERFEVRARGLEPPRAARPSGT